MAGSKTAYLAQAQLDSMLGGDAFTMPTTLYVVLSSSAFSPTATGAACNELTATDYARKAVTVAGAFSAATAAWPSEKHNLADILFATATSDWGTPMSVYLADSATVGAGNLLYGADLADPLAVATGDTAKIKATELIFNEK